MYYERFYERLENKRMYHEKVRGRSALNVEAYFIGKNRMVIFFMSGTGGDDGYY